MHIEPTYTSVGSLFQYRPMFFIPKYQRAYAWDSESISDFIKDLKNCFDKRQSGSPINHFFGGVLSVKHYVSGAVNQHEYEIIDGQQRIATFILLVSRIIKNYEKLLSNAQDSDNLENISIIKRRIELLKPRFIVYKSRVYDFAGTSIEHVYPRNADTANKDSEIEPLKNTLGNLTIMDPAQNTIGGNDSFIQKRSLYQNSSVMLTKEIGEKATWTTNEIENQQNLLIDAAVKIFRP